MGRKRTGTDKPCDGCGEVFYVPRWKLTRSEKHYCSHRCYSDNDVAKRVGEKHPSFQKDDPSYAAVHQWAQKRFACPGECEECGHDGSKSPLQWAQKHGTGNSRDRDDWRRLCAKCHWHYDAESRDVTSETMAAYGRLGAEARWG